MAQAIGVAWAHKRLPILIGEDILNDSVPDKMKNHQTTASDEKIVPTSAIAEYGELGGYVMLYNTRRVEAPRGQDRHARAES